MQAGVSSEFEIFFEIHVEILSCRRRRAAGAAIDHLERPHVHPPLSFASSHFKIVHLVY